ncbi:REST corepressor 2 [Xenotaenia resolanae]|uniref:REST corepressor 2 n=1 Tax=Xenotaenia resolanae TaxID=208358 RepID=A0ABV0WTF1_9TELE
MDRQARRLINKREKDDSNDEIEEGEPGNDSDFEIDAKKEAVKQNPSSTSSDKATPSRSGPVKKESIGAQYRHHPLRARRRPPKGMHLDQADITALSTSNDAGVLSIRQLDTQLVSLKRQVGFTYSLHKPELWVVNIGGWCPQPAIDAVSAPLGSFIEVYSEVHKESKIIKNIGLNLGTFLEIENLSSV